MTLEAIAAELGVTRERVRQIETAAIVKVRRRLRRLGVVDLPRFQADP